MRGDEGLRQLARSARAVEKARTDAMGEEAAKTEGIIQERYDTHWAEYQMAKQKLQAMEAQRQQISQDMQIVLTSCVRLEGALTLLRELGAKPVPDAAAETAERH